jgi:8-oxo-dGTP pyrophosphatase MutT (NUDIX family)
MAFPGGKKENADVNFEATALREANEEIGLQPENVEIIGQLTELFLPPSNFLIKVFVAYAAQKPALHPNEAEVQAIVEVSISDLSNKQNQQIKEFYAGALNRQLSAPYYKINNEEVWGATAMIISELLDVINSK